MTDKQKYAIEMAASIMKNHISQHCNMALGNRESGVVVCYTEAINILLDMLLSDSKILMLTELDICLMKNWQNIFTMYLNIAQTVLCAAMTATAAMVQKIFACQRLLNG